MKHLFAIGLLPLLLAFSLVGTDNNTPAETAELTSSKITWKAYKVTGQHEGTVDLKSGNLDFDADGNLTGGMFEIDMTSINVTDLTGEYKGKLEGHLKSDDFFSTANHPTATLKITNVAAKGTPGDYKVVGDLTIKGITKQIKFYTNIMEKDGQKVATADIKVDRSEYNVKYGSGSFFSNLGDKTIYDEFDIQVKLMAN